MSPKKLQPRKASIGKASIVSTQHLHEDDDETQVQDSDLMESGQRFEAESEDLFASHHLPPAGDAPSDEDKDLPSLSQARGDDDDDVDDPPKRQPCHPPSTQPAPGGSGATAKTPAGKKKSYRAKNRPPKGEIPQHNFSDGESDQVVQFLKDHPVLYDKSHAEYHNSREKDRLWQEFAEEHMPHVDWMRCRAHYDTGRSDLGKILNREDKSGAAAPYNRGKRAQAIFEKWGFLEKYIRTHTRRRTVDSASGGGGGSESDVASMSSGLSQHSIQRRQKQKKDAAAPNVPPKKKTRRPTSDQEDVPTRGPSPSTQEEGQLREHVLRTNVLFDRLLDRLPAPTPESSPATTSRFPQLEAVAARIPAGHEFIATWAAYMIEEQLTMSQERARRFQRNANALLGQEQEQYEKQLQEQYHAEQQQYAAHYHAQQQQEYEKQAQQQQLEKQAQQQQQPVYTDTLQSPTTPNIHSMLQNIQSLLEGSPRQSSSAAPSPGYNMPAATSTLAPYGSSPAGGAAALAKMSILQSPMKTYTTMYPVQRRASTAVPSVRPGTPGTPIIPASPNLDLFDVPNPRHQGTHGTSTTPVQPTTQDTEEEETSASVIVTTSQ